jgi:hypothetical protein
VNVRVLLCTVAGAIVAATAGALVAAPSVVPPLGSAPSTLPPPLPARLQDTGLYRDGSASAVREDNLPFSPQYPLWSDGATKRRWIHVPRGTAIDASNPDAWQFPPGTKLWKEFSLGRRIETRFIERLADGSWRYATYAWNENGSDAELVPDDGAIITERNAPGGRYAIPSRADCVACHEGAAVPVLGFGALQLSSDRDPLAPHAERVHDDFVDLDRLVALGLLRNLPQSLVDKPPRIVASTPTARAALGYLHANCGHCHNDGAAVAGIDLVLAQRTGDAVQSSAAVLQSLVGHASRFHSQGADKAQRVVPGSAGTSVIAQRMQSRNPYARMPPLGVQVVDADGLALVERWIRHDLHP